MFEIFYVFYILYRFNNNYGSRKVLWYFFFLFVLGHRFGAGVSFSAYASYASHYCDKSLHDTMLLCYVLVSNIVEVPESRNRQTVLLEPPFLPNMFTKRYDTTAKNKHTMDVIVKFGSDTFYPAYVINFKRCSQSSPQSLSLSDEELVLLIRSMGFDSDWLIIKF